MKPLTYRMVIQAFLAINLSLLGLYIAAATGVWWYGFIPMVFGIVLLPERGQ